MSPAPPETGVRVPIGELAAGDLVRFHRTGPALEVAAVQPRTDGAWTLHTADGRALHGSTAACLYRLAHDPRTPATQRSTAMDLDGYLDQLSAQLDDIHEARASGGRVAPGSQALILLGQLARLQRLSGFAMRAAVAQALDAGLDWQALAPHAQMHPDQLRDQFGRGGRIIVDHAQPSREATSDRAAPADARATDDVLAALERQLDHTSDRLREAIADYEALKAIAADATDPRVTGRANAHQTLASNRWTAALGARAALEAAYQDLAGRPSHQHEADARVLADHGIAPSPVGLDDRHPQTADFLAAHAAGRHADPADGQRRDRSASGHGLEL